MSDLEQPRDDYIERVARKMCEALGMDPSQQIKAFPIDTYTPRELWDMTGGGVKLIKDNPRAIAVARWQTFRREAALAIAGAHAINAVVK